MRADITSGRSGSWRSACVAALALVGLVLCPDRALAQLDPLLFVKRVPPTVIVALDTSFRMLDDGSGNYYDPYSYPVAGDPLAATLGVPATASTYRRLYRGLQFTATQDASNKYTATTIAGIPSTSAFYPNFYASTRLEMAKRAIRQAVEEQPIGPRWGLVKLRQNNPAWRAATSCDRPVAISGWEWVSDACAGIGIGVHAPTVGAANASIESGSGTIYAPSFTNSNATSISTLLQFSVGSAGGIVPAGLDGFDYQDRPLAHLLDDARAVAVSSMTADTTCRACRNTVVILITGGKDDGPIAYRNTHNVASVAATFASVSASGTTKRVPIYVIAIRPDAADESQLEQIADNSGGQYYKALDSAGVVRAINLAVQAGYSRAVDFNQSRASEYLPVSPLVGTVQLMNAETASGSTLPSSETDIRTPQGTPIPLRSNLMLTAGFALGGPVDDGSLGFEGRLRAFRAFKPVADVTKPAGYKFVQDGTPLWPDRDGRPELAGLARTVADPAQRNIYTYVPGAGVVSFDTAHVATLQTPIGLSASEASTLITFVRALPLGAIIGSTPAVMDPPSLDPPPDEDYGAPGSDDTYASDLEDRRTMVFFGANDGMIHAVDARTGYEVWAFIPYNLLPKLKTLRDGQPVEQFDYFVDSSPKIAEVKVDGTWKSLLIIGQSMGGTFYQAFDVTQAGMGGPAPDSDDYMGVLATFTDPARIAFQWSFPDYNSFDPSYQGTFALSDGWPGGTVKFYGDLKVSASATEKSVGFTWSDPAVGPLRADRSVNVAIVGSGYFPAVTLPGRSGDYVGRALYLLDLRTGRPLGNPSTCAGSASGCMDVGDVNSNSRKNALQADPTAAGVGSGTYITKAYVGDIDGNYWRFDITGSGGLTRTALLSSRLADQPIYASSALMLVGSASQYAFFATGSDLLPTTTDGGAGPFTMYGLLDQGASSTVKLATSLAVSSSRGAVTSIERASTSPSVAGDIVFFTTTTESFSSLCQDFSSRLYAFTYQGGAAYDTDGSGSISRSESAIISTAKGRATSPFIVDQHLFFSTTSNDGGSVEAFGHPEDFNNGVGQVGVRILSWREIR